MKNEIRYIKTGCTTINLLVVLAGRTGPTVET